MAVVQNKQNFALVIESVFVALLCLMVSGQRGPVVLMLQRKLVELPVLACDWRRTAGKLRQGSEWKQRKGKMQVEGREE